MRGWRSNPGNPGKELAAGLIAGLAASWVMNRFQDGLAKLGARLEGTPWSASRGGSGGGSSRASAAGGNPESSEPATRLVAAAVAERVLHRELRPRERPAAETAVHYGYGTLVGGLYGMGAARWQAARAGSGSLFGAGLWLLSDEMALPALGIAKPVQAYPAKVHAGALAAHVVYGVSLEAIRRAVCRLW